MFNLKKWVGEKYKMRLDIDGYKTDLYKDGLRVYCTLDTRIQKLTSDVFQDYMEKNQKDLYNIYTSATNKGLLDSVILISKNRKKIELRSYYKTKFSNSLEAQIIDKEISKWKKFNKSDEKIDLIIDSGKHIGENFYDCNKSQSICEGDDKWISSMGNGIYDFGERFIDGNKQYNKGERFTDANKNNEYNPGEMFIDNKNNKYDSDGEIIVKLRKEIDNMVNHSKTMLNILYNLKQPVPKEYKQIQKKYNNKALEKFHIISSQFTFHYYFKDDSTFDGVMQNIKNNIAKGGYFIGCCYDGLKVFETLKEGDLEFKDSDGKLIYSIEKQYEIDDFTFDPNNPEDNIDNMLGQKIDVFMESIGQKISEYLVNFQYLRYYMENNGFKLLSPNVNSKYKNLLKENNITDGFGDFEKVIKNLKGLSDQDKDLQEKGYYHKALDILKDTTYNKDKSVKEQGYEKLRQLSSLNKYFIFQKE